MTLGEKIAWGMFFLGMAIGYSLGWIGGLFHERGKRDGEQP